MEADLSREHYFRGRLFDSQISSNTTQNADFVEIIRYLKKITSTNLEMSNNDSLADMIELDIKSVGNLRKEDKKFLYWLRELGLRGHVADIILRSRYSEYLCAPNILMPPPSLSAYPNLFYDRNSKDLSERFLFPAENSLRQEVVQFIPRMQTGRLTWQENFGLKYDAGFQLTEPLRPPALILRKLVRSRYTSLDSNIIEVSIPRRTDSSSGRNHDSKYATGTSKRSLPSGYIVDRSWNYIKLFEDLVNSRRCCGGGAGAGVGVPESTLAGQAAVLDRDHGRTARAVRTNRPGDGRTEIAARSMAGPRVQGDVPEWASRPGNVSITEDADSPGAEGGLPLQVWQESTCIGAQGQGREPLGERAWTRQVREAKVTNPTKHWPSPHEA